MRNPEEMITRGKGNFLHCTDYEDAVQAIKDYAKPFIDSLSEANKLTAYHIEQSVKKDIEISELKMEIEKLKTK